MFALRALLAFLSLVAPLFIFYKVKNVNLISAPPSNDKVCPGSASFFHAKCQQTLTIDRKCSDVTTEIMNRLQGNNGWTDMHNGGHYEFKGDVKDNSYGGIEIWRKTGNGKYTDKMILGFFDFHEDKQYCDVRACSESQVPSYYDVSTNYCNARVLVCGTADGCPVSDKANGDFKITDEKYEDCKWHDKGQCKGSHTFLRGEGGNEEQESEIVQYV